MHDYTNQLIEERYLAIAVVGRGGFGTVYRGKQVRVGRDVAIKVLHADFSSRETIVKRFLLEGQAASAVKHPGTVEVIDVGVTSRGDPYIVMEQLEGESLAQLLERNGPSLPAPAAYAIAAALLSGLAAAHKSGVVHRDLKPDNIFLVYADDAAPTVKLIDFGIAKIMHDDGDALTETGQVLGTPAYLSPEQARGSSDIDERSDIYSMAVLLFEMVAGRLPYPATSRNELLARILGEELTEQELTDGIPAELIPVLVGALRHEREHRTPSAEALLACIEALPGFEDGAAALANVTADAFEPTLAVGDLGTPVESASPRSADSVLAEMLRRTPSPASMDRRSSPTPIRRGWVPLGLGLAAVAVAVMALRRPSNPQPVSGSASTGSPTPSSAAELPTRVVITLRGLPAGATFSFDGRGHEDNPFETPRSSEPSRLQIRAPGHAPVDIALVPDRDQLVNVVMVALPDPDDRPPSQPQPPSVDLGI